LLAVYYRHFPGEQFTEQAGGGKILGELQTLNPAVDGGPVIKQGSASVEWRLCLYTVKTKSNVGIRGQGQGATAAAVNDPRQLCPARGAQFQAGQTRCPTQPAGGRKNHRLKLFYPFVNDR
jgi:hypothetical protein